MDQTGMEMTIFDTYLNLQKYLGNHECVCVSVSGGADSDVIVHMIATQFREHLHKTHFVFSNTGLEYEATKRHLDEMEEKYGIKIERIRGKPIPWVVKKYGIPFVSKQVSEYMGRLQAHNFDWRDGDLENLCTIFGKCRAALRWWCNDWGDWSRFNINWNKGLKEGLMKNPPKFRTSAICCQKSKKEPLMKFQHDVKADLLITGERKSEGGQRARKSGCFEHTHGIDHYMPLFHWDDATKANYVEREGVIHSDCYLAYGLRRTGCVGCPFGQNIAEELRAMKKHEPNLYNACLHVFGQSYKLMDELGMRKEKILDDEGLKKVEEIRIRRERI